MDNKLKTFASPLLICVALAVLAWSSIPLLQFSQATERAEHQGFLYEQVVHEAGYGRIAIALLGAIIALVPYRKREPWAWWSLALVVLLYLVPTQIIPYTLGASWETWNQAWRDIGQSSLARGRFLGLSLLLLVIIALALSFTRPTNGRAD